MAEFVEVMKNKKRMCDYIGNCNICQVGWLDDGSFRCGIKLLEKYPEKAEKIINAWAAANKEEKL